jgi:hypothetical protein
MNPKSEQPLSAGLARMPASDFVSTVAIEAGPALLPFRLCHPVEFEFWFFSGGERRERRTGLVGAAGWRSGYRVAAVMALGGKPGTAGACRRPKACGWLEMVMLQERWRQPPLPLERK